jgi:hypothetical protein
MSIITTATLVGVGGIAPYTFVAPSSDPKTSLPNGSFSISGSTLSINSTSLSPGANTLHVVVTDSALNTADAVLTILIVDPTLFTILNNAQNFQPASFPSVQSIPLTSSGGTGSIKWTLLSSVTTLPGVTIDINNHLNFTFNNYGTWTVGVQATDSLNNVTSKVLQIQAVNSQVAALVDGQVEIIVKVPAQKSGVNQFTLKVTDNTAANLTQTFSYKSDEPISNIFIDQFAFDHYWGHGDTTTVILPIAGSLSGYSISSSPNPITLANGLTYAVDGVNDVVSVTGSPNGPTAYLNNQVYIQLPILQGNNQVATITREYTLITHDGTSDIGTTQCFTRPYIVGDFVGLNALKPWFNSPSIAKASTLSARVQTGSSLPPGLSLDANTALIYGNLVGIATSQSVLEYYDAQNTVHGTVTITWDTQQNAFSLLDNITDGHVQQTYSSTINSSSSVKLTSATVYRGRLPAGLSLSPDVTGAFINISGTPTEAGYFDLWFRVTNQNGQSAYLYHRLVINYVNPLVILTTTLPNAVTGQVYNGSGFVLQGYGGTTPYTWSLDASSPALPTGMTLNSAGLLSGTPTSSSYNQNLVIDLTDARGVTTSAVLNLAINNNVQITTVNLPKVIPGQPYSYQMTAQGGVPPYTWSQSGPALPSGIAFNTSTGVFSGVTSTTSYIQSITIGVVDTVGGAGHTDSKTYSLQTGTSAMLIDTSGIGAVDRGGPYQGLLKAFGTFTSPNTWQVTPDSPNPLPTGLTLQANAADNGVTAFISGVSTTLLSNYSVKVQTVDHLGSSAQAFIILNSTSSLTITTKALPVGTVTASYSYQLTATGYNTPFTWSETGSLPSGYSLSSGGLLTGTSGATFNGTPVFKVTDSLGDTYPLAPNAQAALNLVVQPSGMSITTASINQVTSGRAFSQTLTATGGSGNYSWSISPASASQLPAGLSLGASNGVINGTTTQTGFSQTITFRVTDNTNGAFAERSYAVSVISGLTLSTGIDSVDGINTGYLGYVSTGNTDSITPRPNMSFYVYASGVTTTNAATLASGISISNSGFVASVDNLSSGVAAIRISGPFASASVGDNTFGITVVDSGVSVTGTFKWKVYNDGVLRATATNAFPQQVV